MLRANRDPEIFDDPDDFRVDRERKRALGFRWRTLLHRGFTC